MAIQMEVPIGAFRTPVDVFRIPKRHEGSVAAGPADGSYRAFELLYLVNVAVPVICGFAKWFQAMVTWPKYLAPGLAAAVAPHAMAFLNVIGLCEIVVGAVTLARPRWGGWAAAVWLWLGALNFIMSPGHGGLVLCLLALSAGAVCLSLLAKDYERRPRGS